jgi:hypothetical protein
MSYVKANKVVMNKNMDITANFYIGETHEFGATNITWYIYSDGKKFDFLAEKTMEVKTVEVKTWLASNKMATFHIEVSVRDNVVATWDQPVNAVTTFKEYFNTKQTTFSLKQGDKIGFKIYGNSFSSPEGGLLGVNYVRLISN